jgi:hypothetical protein
MMPAAFTCTSPQCVSNIVTCFVASFGFAALATCTWFFSSRPRQYIRCFVPRDAWRGAVHAFLRDPQFTPGLRGVAYLQFGVAALFFLGTLAGWLFVS